MEAEAIREAVVVGLGQGLATHARKQATRTEILAWFTKLKIQLEDLGISKVSVKELEYPGQIVFLIYDNDVCRIGWDLETTQWEVKPFCLPWCDDTKQLILKTLQREISACSLTELMELDAKLKLLGLINSYGHRTYYVPEPDQPALVFAPLPEKLPWERWIRAFKAALQELNGE